MPFQFFSKPIKKMLVHDPYLNKRHVIIDRLGQYITMASQHNSLERVDVYTKREVDGDEQEAAIRELNRKHSVDICFDYRSEHDRFIEVTRVDGERAQIILGRGLDFIQPDGSTKPTYVIIQDPL